MDTTYGYIYLTTNKINGKRYIGQHKSKDWDYKYFGSGKLLNRAIQKYGIENFTCFPLAWAWNREELNKLEIEYIAHCKPEYNLAKGGEGGSVKGRIVSAETKKKMSKKRKNKINLGHKCSDETRKRMSENHADFSGQNHPFFGKHQSKEVKRKISESVKKYWSNKKIA
jgi:group I intron endonuclease